MPQESCLLYTSIKFGKTHPKVYSELTTDHPIDLVRYQVANCYMGRAGLINSGGESGKNDLQQAVRTAVINLSLIHISARQADRRHQDRRAVARVCLDTQQPAHQSPAS